MLNNPNLKYKPFPKVPIQNREWPDKTITKPPRWLSTDLRDGNQSLPDPMTIDEKKEYFTKLVELGFKEIEVSFPSASQTDFDFTKWAVKNAPEDVSVQVLAPCREDLIKRSIEALEGAHRATVHLYLASSDLFREVVFGGISKEDSIKKAVECTKLVKQLTKEKQNTNGKDTYWTYEFSPETFTDTPLEFAIELCNAVLEEWNPSVENPIIFNLPATVEMSTPNIYADQIEYFRKHVNHPELICISLHVHNDRGCGVAATELGLLAGGQRVEGCLFGNGERTGNVDIVTVALNMYTQGIQPNLDFSNIKSIVDIVEKCNKIPVPARAPYGGSLVVCAFSGSHQDAIKKGFAIHEHKTKESNEVIPWKLPYLPLDPQDIGRNYEAIIRVNSQSGKGGSAWVILKNLQLDLPRGLQIDFSKVVQHTADKYGKELTNTELINLFKKEYFIDDSSKNYYNLLDYSISTPEKGLKQIDADLEINGEAIKISGKGNGQLSAFNNAIVSQLKVNIDVKHYHEHSLGIDSSSKAATYIEVTHENGKSRWGVGIHEDVSQASFYSLISVLNGLKENELI